MLFLQSNWDPSSALHKEMLAVLAAVTEVIKEKGGQETEAEYLGAFLTSLTTLESDMSISATVALVNMVIKRVPQSLIRQRFSDISQVWTPSSVFIIHFKTITMHTQQNIL